MAATSSPGPLPESAGSEVPRTRSQAWNTLTTTWGAWRVTSSITAFTRCDLPVPAGPWIKRGLVTRCQRPAHTPAARPRMAWRAERFSGVGTNRAKLNGSDRSSPVCNQGKRAKHRFYSLGLC